MERETLEYLGSRKWIIGMVHVKALPGTPFNTEPFNLILKNALDEALKLQAAGFDAILIENMHDVPYLKNAVGPEIIACMTSIAVELRKAIQIPMGIQILAAANKEALAVARAADLDFIRAEGFVFAHVADEGYLESCAGELLRYRKQIGAEHIRIYTDVQKKHSSHAITSDIDIKEHVVTASFFRSDGIIITGTSTGREASIDYVRIACQSTQLPLLLGSGISAVNIQKYWNLADAFIVGSSIKNEGKWENDISGERLNLFVKKVNELRNVEG